LSRQPTAAIDLDGTILDARRRQVAVAEAAALRIGWRLDGDAFWREKRRGATTAEAFHALGVANVASSKADRWWREHIERAIWLELDRPLRGALPTLAQIERDGWRVVVLTARRNRGGAQRAFRSLMLSARASCVVVDPDRAALEKADALASSEAGWYVGDSETDHQAALSADVPFTAVSTGQRDAAFLEALGCRVVGTLATAWSSARREDGTMA
jgi:phosphoglycolate phosphatase-like HAD superfamily hydrolase